MRGYRAVLARKVFNLAITLFAILSLNFFLFHILPGDPAKAILPRQALGDPDVEEQVRKFWGFDKPLGEQFVLYIQNLFSLDFGYSYALHDPVAQIMFAALPYTLILVGAGTILSIFVGLVLGRISAAHRGRPADLASLNFSLLFYAMPSFWLGLILVALLAVNPAFFPTSQARTPGAFYSGFLDEAADIAFHAVLPVTTFALGSIALYSMILRSSLIDVLTEDYIMTARAKGLTDRQVLKRHAMPNALLPVTTAMAINIGYIVGGAIQIETVFSWQGLGRLTWDALLKRDYPVLQGLFLLLTFAVILANFLSDILYSYLDPRVRR